MHNKRATQQKKKPKSVEVPGQPKNNPSGLPYGCGSIQVRGKQWWGIYRDTLGRTIQENLHTESQDAARYLLAQRALETARAKVAALEQITHEGQGGAGATPEGKEAGRSTQAAGGDRKKTGKGGSR
jgi:hypothetical protein